MDLSSAAPYFPPDPVLVGLEKQKLELEVDALRRKQRDETVGSYRRRIVDFIGEVNEYRCHTAIEAISRLTAESSEPITLRIDSQGGACSDGLALYDFIQLVRADGVQVNTQGFGLVASMAVILLQAGEKRSLSPHTRSLIHEVSTVQFGSYTELLEQNVETKAVQDMLLDILVSRSTMTKLALRRKWRKTDWWLAPEKMVELGFADEVLR